MKAFISLGRWLFAIPFAVFGLFHFMNAEAMTGAVPAYMPAPSIWVYIGGIGLIGAAVSILIGKYDKLASTLLGIYLLLMVVMVHLPGVMAGGAAAQGSMPMLLKDLALAGAAMMYAQHLSKDRSVIG